MKKPNLFIVGEPRCGTTALHYFLGQHPDIFMSKDKEPMYFAKDYLSELRENDQSVFYDTLDKYLNLFRDAKEKIIGESSTRYLYSKVAAREIYDFNPKAKIVALFRDPVDFLYSYHRQQVYLGNENIDSLEKSLDLEEGRKNGENLPKKVKYPSSLYYSERVKFADHLSRFLNYFPREQIKIIIFENFKKDNQSVFKDLLEFLEVESQIEVDFRKINRGRKIKNEFLFSIPSKLSFLKRIMPLWFRKKGAAWFKIMGSGRDKKEINSKLRERLRKKFFPEVKNLDKLVDQNLIRIWNYE